MANTSTKPPMTHPAYKILERAHSPDTATALFTDKIVNKPLLLHPTQPDPRDNKRTRRRHIRLWKKRYYLRKQKPKPLSAKSKRELGVHKLNREKGEYRYDVYEGLHKLWCGYMAQVLGLDENPDRTISAVQHGSFLASADFHGAEVEVVRCGCAGRVGIKGIVVRDTKFTFVIVTRRDEVKVVPKAGAVFRYEVPVIRKEGDGKDEKEVESRRLVLEVHGSQMELRPAERATRKFKWKAMDYL